MNAANGHVGLIWDIAELLRGNYKRSEYGRVILPFTVLRRLDLVLEPSKQQVLEEVSRYPSAKPELILRRAAGQSYYNTSELSLEKAHDDPSNLADHLDSYARGFSPIARGIFEAFGFFEQVKRLQEADLLYKVVGRFLDKGLDLHPNAVSNAAMGDIFEELIRRFSEISNETAGEHFTPREVVRLCVRLVLAGDPEVEKPAIVIRKAYDPACGTGGMLSTVDELVREINPKARLFLFGQEVNPESWAICRAEMLLKGGQASRIHARSTLSADGLPGERFDYLLANPPFGVDWSKDHEAVIEERDGHGWEGRFGAGTPRKSDGALLFLQTMLAKMKRPEEGGGRVAVVFNGSPLFSGGAGSGESEIRRWILSNDWLEAIVALPEQLFYNTGIATYVWVLTNRKEERRRGKVQLIDARELWEPMPTSMGDKRRRLSPRQIEEIVRLRDAFEEDGRSKIRENGFFCSRRIVVERPQGADSQLRDYEQVPMDESVEEYMRREVLPFAPEARVDDSKERIATRIPFTQLFHRREEPRPLEQIDAEIETLEMEIRQALERVVR